MKTVTDKSEIVGNCLVKFGATWCGPCKAVKPVLEKVENTTGVTVFDVDIDESSQIAEEFGVRSVPTVFALKDGQPVGMIVGAKGEFAYLDLIEKLK
jgi:thioredoxin 1